MMNTNTKNETKKFERDASLDRLIRRTRPYLWRGTIQLGAPWSECDPALMDELEARYDDLFAYMIAIDEEWERVRSEES